MISPFFEKLAGEVEGAEFYKVDVDAAEDISLEVGVRAVSTRFSVLCSSRVPSRRGEVLRALAMMMSDGERCSMTRSLRSHHLGISRRMTKC